MVVAALEDPGHPELQVGVAAEDLGQESRLFRRRRIFGAFFGLESFLRGQVGVNTINRSRLDIKRQEQSGVYPTQNNTKFDEFSEVHGNGPAVLKFKHIWIRIEGAS